ncbi:MAG: Asp-tRNA(Asn)/Glu-tRNA(Gln) amidotransferase subunit GatC [Candidatus Woykebacteria bacterium]
MKRKISTDEVKHVAKLANLPLTAAEVKKFSSQLSEVIDYNISLLTKVDTTGVEPTAHVTGAENIKRKDETEPGLSQKEALQNTKSSHNGFFKVKAVLDR